MSLQRYLYFFITILTFSFSLSCTKGPNISNIPALEYQGVSKDTIRQSVTTDDSFVLFLHIEDGDGDIGNDDNDGVFNLFIIDSRTGQDYDQPVLIPKVPESVSKRGVLIDMELRLFPPCCIYDDSTPPCVQSSANPLDSLTLDIHLVDRAGNLSNTVTSDMIYILCD